MVGVKKDGKVKALSKPWSEMSAEEKRVSSNYVFAIIGACFLIAAWFVSALALLLAFIGMLGLIFAARKKLSELGKPKEICPHCEK